MWIMVRQNEIIVVRGMTMMNEVEYMYTYGLFPCVGLVLWCEQMCVLGHFHDLESTRQLDQVIQRFADVARDVNYKAVIVRGNAPSRDTARATNQANSDAKAGSLNDELSVYGLNGEDVLPANPGESAKVRIRLADGDIDYAFDVPPHVPEPTRTSLSGGGVLPDWVNSPWGLNNSLVVGVYKGGNQIDYLGYYERDRLERSL